MFIEMFCLVFLYPKVLGHILNDQKCRSYYESPYLEKTDEYCIMIYLHPVMFFDVQCSNLQIFTCEVFTFLRKSTLLVGNP
jgi:hypothetical protein